MCDAIYIGNIKNKFTKITDIHFSSLQRSIKTGKNQQHFQYTMSCTDLHKCMSFKVVKQLNPILAMKSFTKPICYLCMEERLAILNNLHNLKVILMKKKELYEACWSKANFR